MKQVIFFTVFAATLIGGLMSAQTKADIFGNKNLKITWLGVDFTKVNYIGDAGTVSTTEMVDLFNKINILIPSEQNKYDFKDFFKKDSVAYNISYTIEKNNKIDGSKLISFNSNDYMKLDESAVKTIINSYNFENSEKGVGLIFIMDGLNKMEEEASMWLTFIKMDTKEVLFTERLTGKAGGVGFRNHWAGAIFNVFKKVDNQMFKEWKKKYAPSK